MDDIERLLEARAPRIRGKLRIGPTWQSSIDADDIMQVTYLEAFLVADELRTKTPQELDAWLLRNAENNLRDAIRGLERAKRPNPAQRLTTGGDDESRAQLLEELAATSHTASRSVASREARTALSAAIDRLPTSYRRAVVMFDLEGRPVAEVAASLGRSEGAVYMLRGRAHDRLRAILGTESGFF